MSKLLIETDLIPKFLTIDRNDINLKDKIKAKLNYPFWIRSSTGSSGLGSFLVKNYDELVMWIKLNSSIKNFIANEYLPGRNYACKLLYYEGSLIRSSCAERINYIMSKVSPSGITGNTSFGRLIQNDDILKVSVDAMTLLFKKTGAKPHGFFTVDLKEDTNNNIKITEINLRHVAFTQCFAMAGANLCEDVIRILDNDRDFNYDYNNYSFDKKLVFLRDVDERPIVINEDKLFRSV